jgi:hypothetical protein
MAEENQQEEEKVPAEITSNIVRLAEFLDPHLRAASKTDASGSPKRWRAHKAAAFILAASLILWAAIFAIVHYAYRFLALRGRP